MLMRDTLVLAFGALRAHKLRTALTLLGLIIGVTSLILVMTLIQGANWYVESKIANLGADIFQVSKNPVASVNFNEVLRGLKHRDLTEDDWHEVQARCRNCVDVGAQADVSAQIRGGGQWMRNVEIRGQSVNMGEISGVDIARGRFFSDGEARASAPVAVVGQGVVEELFSGRDALGKTFRVAGEEFTIVGINEPIGSILGQDQDNFALMPLGSFRKIFGHRGSLVLQVQTVPPLEPAIDEVRLILRARRHVPAGERDDFYFTTADTYLALWSDISSVFFLVFVLISSVSSLVGGIVIMNITLVSVAERTKEIGLRRSLGATQRDIARQFLIEVLAQCLAGGLFGVALGFGIAVLLRQFTPFPASVQWWVAGMGLALASVIALIFGLYPAVMAARLDPVVALRTE